MASRSRLALPVLVLLLVIGLFGWSAAFGDKKFLKGLIFGILLARSNGQPFPGGYGGGQPFPAPYP